MWFAIVAAALAAVDGETPELDRSAPRVHWELSAAGTLPLGAGLHVELGTVLDDRHVLSVRASGAAGLISVLTLGASFAEWVGERLTFGIGTDLVVYPPNDQLLVPLTFGMHVPVRVTFLLMPREVTRERRGLIIGLEFASGFAVGRSPALPSALGLSFLGTLTFGWASW